MPSSSPTEQGWSPLTAPSVWTNERPVYGRGAAASEAVVSSLPISPPPVSPPFESLISQAFAGLPPRYSPPPYSGSSENIRVGPGGRIQGVDGMLDQIAQALTRHAGPMLARDVLPIVQRDEALQTRVGQAAGVAMADNLRPWIIAGVGALGILAVIEGYRFYAQRKPKR